MKAKSKPGAKLKFGVKTKTLSYRVPIRSAKILDAKIKFILKPYIKKPPIRSAVNKTVFCSNEMKKNIVHVKSSEK